MGKIHCTPPSSVIYRKFHYIELHLRRCTVYINRGWVPRSLYSKQQWQLSSESEEARDQSAPPTRDAPQKQADSWARPEGAVSVVAVMGEGEKVAHCVTESVSK